jgi:predicted pyridoxine 5'-phosphate oxidase superfamily flavin-nucleotide-binding protein
MMFMIPGFDDIYRVNGRAAATNDKALLDTFIEFGKPPRLILRIDVDEAFIHCPKALMRAKLWNPDVRVARDRLPSIAEIIADHMKLSKQSVSVEQILDNFKDQF